MALHRRRSSLLAPQAMLRDEHRARPDAVGASRSFVRPRSSMEYSRHIEDASAESIGAIQQALGGIRDIKLLQREDAFVEIHLHGAAAHRQASNYKSSILSSLSPLAIETSLILTIVAVFVLATDRGRQRRADAGDAGRVRLRGTAPAADPRFGSSASSTPSTRARRSSTTSSPTAPWFRSGRTPSRASLRSPG
jgi:hypothetical protein